MAAMFGLVFLFLLHSHCHFFRTGNLIRTLLRNSIDICVKDNACMANLFDLWLFIVGVELACNCKTSTHCLKGEMSVGLVCQRITRAIHACIALGSVVSPYYM